MLCSPACAVIRPAAPSEPTAVELDTAALLAAREEREARAGAIATGRRSLDARNREIGRLVSVAIGGIVVGAAGWWFITDLLPTL